MNRQQRSMLIAVVGMLALILVVILVIALNQRGPEPAVTQPEPLAATDIPDASDFAAALDALSEEEMGRLAMSEEEEKDGAEEELPID